MSKTPRDTMISGSEATHEINRDRMRFLVVTFDPPENVGGVEGRVRTYSTLLNRKGYFVKVLVFDNRQKSKQNQNGELEIIRLPSSPLGALGALREVKSIISRYGVSQVLLVSGALTLNGLALLAYSKLVKVNSASFFYGRDLLRAKRGIFSRLVLWLSLYLSCKVIVNSLFTSNLLPTRFEGKTSVLYPSVDTSLHMELYRDGTDSSGFRILFVGRLVKRKGVQVLLDAFARIVKEFPSSRLEIVGDGSEKNSLRSHTATLGIEDKVRFWGELVGPPLHSLFSRADVFAMPSASSEDDVEGFGTVFLEAGLHGKPSVGTHSGGIPEAIVDGVTGFIISEGDPSLLASKLRVLLKDKRLRSEMGERARRRVLGSFDNAKAVDRLISILGGSNDSRDS
jgi:glycosyltransferase involved in cell wall biosynthesis